MPPTKPPSSYHRFLPLDAMLARYMLSPSVRVCSSVCVCLSVSAVTSRCSTKTAKRDRTNNTTQVLKRHRYERDKAVGTRRVEVQGVNIFVHSGYSHYYTLRTSYDTRCYFNVHSKAGVSQLDLPHGTNN